LWCLSLSRVVVSLLFLLVLRRPAVVITTVA
jgi:hypothetical protein